ncbi:MAG: 3D domain-containing protein [Oscillospiraceae bacterium]
MVRQLEMLRRRLRAMPRLAASLLGAGVLSGCLFSVIPTVDIVTVVDAGVEHMTLMTAATSTPQEIVELAGVEMEHHDEVAYTATGGNVANVTIHRAFPVSLVADGETHTSMALEGTVADLVAEAGIQLRADDYVLPALDTALEDGLSAQVYRVSYACEKKQEALDAEAVDAYKATLCEEEQAEFVESYNAVYDILYLNRLVNGEVEFTKILELEPQVQPRPADSYAITPGVPTSRITGYEDIQMGPDGLPQNYTRVMPGAITTAYSSSGGRGASGLGLYCGTVAVNPNVIPYGTRLYITSSDGSFVYGFAIATDTGIALMEGVIDIDLYFETNAECYQFGKRPMDVYILD